MSRLMMRLSVAALVTIVACSDGPTSPDQLAGELVITEGAAAPVQAPHLKPSFSDAFVAADLGGSVATPVNLKPQTCDAGQSVKLTYTVTGRQANPASFKVYTVWTYDGSSWTGSSSTTVNVPARAATDPATTLDVTITVVNASAVSSGTSTFAVSPFDLVTTPQATLNVSTAGITIYTSFAACAAGNTPPTLVVPADFSVEATSSAGATVDYASLVTANDLEDGDLTGSVSCAPASGTVFPLGPTTVHCSVTDSGNETVTADFTVTVVDTTPPVFTSIPTGTVTLIAADINGAVLDIDAFGITAADVGGVSEPSTVACVPTTGTILAIGSTTQIDCTATDAVGNTSAPSSFDVFVGLTVAGTGFLPPLRMEAPFSAHKRGSTIPHKFLPPTYADGTPATDLAADLRLVVKQITSDPGVDAIEANDFSAGSTAWRYDPDAGQYVFNLKTGTSSPWNEGSWQTTVSYKGIVLATTQFNLRR